MNATIKRTKGRPARAESVNIRQSILETAERLFAEKSYSAVSIKEIADEVSVNPAMVHYYFDNKQTLLQNVMERAIEPLAEAIKSMQQSGGASLDSLIGMMLNTLRENPHLPTLVAREVLLPGGVMRQHFQTFLAPRIGGAIPALIENEQRAGRIRTDINPEISALTLLSLCIFPFLSRGLSEPVLHISFDANGLEQLRRHIVLLLSEGYAA